MQRWLDGDLVVKDNGGSLPDWVRRWLIARDGEKCCKCGWEERHPITGNVPVEIDHIDGDAANNQSQNLRLLCPNHHSLTPTYRNLNAGKGRPYRRAKMLAA